MTPAARLAAAIGVLDRVLAGTSVERELTNWARASRFAGSKDRAAVRDIVFDCLRNLRSYHTISGQVGGRGLALGWCLDGREDLDALFSGQGYGPPPLSPSERTPRSAVKPPEAAEAADMQDWLWPMLQADHGAQAMHLARALCRRAPLDLRVNLARTTVEEAARGLGADGIRTETVKGVPGALRVTENPRRVAGSAAYLAGLVEIQDAASQAVVDLLPLRPGLDVLDYCAGGGGKTLAIAGRAPGARISAWDISTARLAALRPRAERAAAQVRLLAASPQEAAFDLVLVDAPCSGSGAWRRSPEGKWRLTPDRLEELRRMQRGVLDGGWSALRPGGVMAYATCSILSVENRAQVDSFLERTPDARLATDRSFTLGAPGDGFYVALVKKAT